MALRIIENHPSYRVVLEGTKDYRFLTSVGMTLVFFVIGPVVWDVILVLLLGWETIEVVLTQGMEEIWGWGNQWGIIGSLLAWVLEILVGIGVWVAIGWAIYRFWQPGVGLKTLSVNRMKGEIRWSHFRAWGWTREQVVPIEKCVGLTLQDGPPSFASLPEVVRTLWKNRDHEKPEFPPYSQSFMKGFRLELLLLSTKGALERKTFRVSIQGIETAKAGANFAWKLAQAIQLPYGKVFSIPHVGYRARFARDPQPGLDLLSGQSPVGDFPSPDLYTGPELSEARLPPFDPAQWKGDLRLGEWSPGRRVEFHRRFSLAIPLAFPFTLLVLIGPLLAYINLFEGEDFQSKWLPVVVIGIFGLLIGGLAILAIWHVRPRKVVFDWETRELRMTSWYRTRVIPFHRINRLEFQGRKVESSGSDSSSSSTSFGGRLQAVLHRVNQEKPQILELASTNFKRHSDAPFLVGAPLLHELSESLGIAGNVLSYSSENLKHSNR